MELTTALKLLFVAGVAVLALAALGVAALVERLRTTPERPHATLRHRAGRRAA
jgi:hypothetical protein